MDWFEVSGDGTRLVVHDEGDLAVLPSYERGDDDTTVILDLRRILHEVDPAAEWRQAYAEAGRIVRDHFWSPDMCGIDWDAVLAQYRPLVERVASPEEFADLLRELLGELGTSHAYVHARPAQRGPGPLPAAHRTAGGGLRTRPGRLAGRCAGSCPASPPTRRPAPRWPAPASSEGARLTHVDGRPVDPVAGPAPLLAGAGGTTVELTFTPPPDPADGHRPARRIAVSPLIDERPLRYQDWVAERRSRGTGVE